ncbi:MAG TPA: hypothetical protein VGL61_15390 [Kofleriaceae bacterium]|jgi:hypothetical protein
MRALALLIAACSAPTRPPAPNPAPSGPETLAFHRREGAIDNYFFRRGPIAAHVAITSGAKPRVIVAFPAGNEGVGLWLDGSGDLAATAPVPATGSGELRGVAIELRASRRLVVREAALGGVRFLRDYNTRHTLPAEVAAMIAAGPPVTLRRTLLDGAHLEVTLAGAARVVAGSIEFSPGAPITLTALCDEPPLTPIETGELVDRVPPGHDTELDALAFLSYREKLLAGSWRFLTYFGRDTLLTLRLLMPHARPELVEAGLSAVVDRLDGSGDVAHEEDVGDFAAWENLRDGRGSDASPRFDYKMIDDDLLLAPLLASYAQTSPARVAGLLARHTPSGRSYADAIASNLAFVMREARPYAAAPDAANLVHLHAGFAVGDWRDSELGLAGGRIPYDVNAALMPAALEAAAQLYAWPELHDEALAAEAKRLAAAWAHVADAFRVEIPADDAKRRVASYAESLGLPENDAGDAIASIDAPVVLRAIALDADGTPIPVMHSDDGFMMLFGTPSAEMLDEIAGRIVRPFPAGLRTPVGIVVANPVFASIELQRELGRAAYHGTVVWSWQQAMLAAGFDRQLARTDLPATTRRALGDAQRALWSAIRGAPGMTTSELWSWSIRGGAWRVAPFGQGGGDADESDAAQLWSTVYLAISPPR